MAERDSWRRMQFGQLLEEGYTVQAAAERVGVTLRTGYRWKRDMAGHADQPALLKVEEDVKTRTDTIESTCEMAQVEALRGLVRRVRGYVLEERKMTFELNEQGLKRMKGEVVTCKEVAPDLTAIVFVLTNADAAHWPLLPGKGKSRGNGAVECCDSAQNEEVALDLSRLSDVALDELMALFEEPVRVQETADHGDETETEC